MQIMDFSGSVLAYALSALEKAMTYNTGWEVISEQHLEKVSLPLSFHSVVKRRNNERPTNT